MSDRFVNLPGKGFHGGIGSDVRGFRVGDHSSPSGSAGKRRAHDEHDKWQVQRSVHGGIGHPGFANCLKGSAHSARAVVGDLA